MRRRRLIAVLVALATPLAAARQRTDQQAPSGLILGQVVDAVSGRGVSGAIVTLGAPAPPARPLAELLDIGVPPGPAGATRRGLTTADGRFLFRDLPAGRYAMAATAPGYVPANFGQVRPSGPGQPIDLDDAQKIGDVKITVWQYGAISGIVADERGEPAVGVSVRALRRVIAGGKSRFVAAISATTDDRGMYRAAGLLPGDYAVGVILSQETSPMSAVIASIEGSRQPASDAYRSLTNSSATIVSASGFRIGDLAFRQSSWGVRRPASAPDGRIMTYETQFYSGAASASHASLIQLKSAEDRQGVDLQLRLVPAVRVSGTVTGPGGTGPNLSITLIPPSGADFQSEGMAEAASGATDSTGQFTLLGIPRGQYTLKIRMYPRPPATPGSPAPVGPPAEPSLWAAMPITVADTDLTGLSVVLRHGLTVSGRVEFVGTTPPPTADQIRRMSIRLQSAEGRTSAPIPVDGRATPEGTFRTAGLAGGRYLVSLLGSTLPPGWHVKSAMSAGRDVSIEPLDLTSGDVSDVVLTFTDQTAEISGTVTGANGPDATAEVIAFPADSVAWREIGVPARRGRNERVSKTGAFSLIGLPAGEYYVIAVPGSTVSDWRDPRFLESLSRGAVRVVLDDGGKKTVTLKTAQVR